MTRRVLPPALLGALLALVVLPLLAAAPASAARTVTVSITSSGTKPASAPAAVGDTVTFVNDDPTFVHRVANKSANWSFLSPPLAPGQRFTTDPLTTSGAYVYQGANLDSFTGRVVVPSSTTATGSPAPSKPAAPASSQPSPSSPASPAAASPAASTSPSPTGGTGVVGPPPLAGGFGSINLSPSPGAGGIAPDVAPTLAGEEPSSPRPGGAAVAIGRGRLPEPPTGRRYGLPAALAVVAAAGVASLLVRLLLAHPAAKRSRADAPVTVD